MLYRWTGGLAFSEPHIRHFKIPARPKKATLRGLVNIEKSLKIFPPPPPQITIVF